MSAPAFPYTEHDLDRFRHVQRLAYDIALRIEAQLQVGMTEEEVCTLIAEAQAEEGVVQVFHQPFAWIGPRTMLGPDWTRGTADAADPAAGFSEAAVAPSTGFHPTQAALADGMALIVDLAPALQGTSSDIGYSCVLGSNPIFDELDAGLALVRNFLLEGVRADETMRNLYRELDGLLAKKGWENCHQHYPDRAIGHAVFPLPHEPDHPSPVLGFGTAAAEGLLAARRASFESGTGYPVWNDSARTDRPPSPGLWAVEPHIGRDGVGAKFEELLVVTDDEVYWLDDHLPHRRRWAAAGYPTGSDGRG